MKDDFYAFLKVIKIKMKGEWNELIFFVLGSLFHVMLYIFVKSLLYLVGIILSLFYLLALKLIVQSLFYLITYYDLI
jgi:hypothetical protein